MWKMFGWLWKSIAAALVVSFLAIWTTGYIVNSYVEALLEEYNIPLETQPFALSGLWGTLWGAEKRSADQGQDEIRNGLAADADAGRRPDAAETGTGGGDRPDGHEDVLRHGGYENSARPQNGQEAETWPDGYGYEYGDGAAAGGQAEGADDMNDAAAGGPAEGADGMNDADGAAAPEPGADGQIGFGTGSEARASAGTAGEAVVSTEDLLETKSKLTEDERNRLFAILVGKVPQEEWQTISGYVEGGLTEDELLNVQQIVAAHLDRSEYDELMEILSKY